MIIVLAIIDQLISYHESILITRLSNIAKRSFFVIIGMKLYSLSGGFCLNGFGQSLIHKPDLNRSICIKFVQTVRFKLSVG